MCSSFRVIIRGHEEESMVMNRTTRVALLIAVLTAVAPVWRVGVEAAEACGARRHPRT